METAGAIDLREVFLATLGEAGDETSQAGAEDEKEEGSHWITSERVVIMSIFSKAVAAGATDLHLESGGQRLYAAAGAACF